MILSTKRSHIIIVALLNEVVGHFHLSIGRPERLSAKTHVTMAITSVMSKFDDFNTNFDSSNLQNLLKHTKRGHFFEHLKYNL